MKYSGKDISEYMSTKQKIFHVALDLFSTKGYAATTIRDIASAIDLQPASLYNHFTSKETMLDAIFEFTGKAITYYYAKLDMACHEAETFKEIIDAMFAELENVDDIAIYHCISILVSERFNSPKAHDLLELQFMRRGIELLDSAFAKCISNGTSKDFDSYACATFVMNNVLAGVLSRAGDDVGKHGAYDTTQMFALLKAFLLNFLRTYSTIEFDLIDGCASA